MNLYSLSQFQEGMILPFNKPLTWTSTDLVRKVKNMIHRSFREKRDDRNIKLKVGHAGTLDPLATGMLIICTGKATKQIQYIQDMPKEYIAQVTFGKTTPSFDLETKPEGSFATDHLNDEEITHALDSFMGEIDQMPPIYSAKNINGKRAYEYARKGEEAEMKTNKVTIHELELLHFEDLVATLRVKCSKGTYIRSLAYDLGKTLKSGAHLSGLIRTCIGDYTIDKALTIEDFEKKLASL
ncbi:MAG: tRNA pseudouridine(55) synthase TruB [Bacteroidales bacterium]